MVFPQSENGNPHMRLLTEALREEGIQVDYLRRRRMPFVSNFSRNRRPEIIHLQWQHGYFLGRNLADAVLRTTAFFAQILTLKTLGVSFVWTVHNLVNHEKRLARWELGACRLLARIVDRLVVHCPAAMDEVVRTYGVSREKVVVVPHGHYVDLYGMPEDRTLSRASLSLPAEETVYLFFGQIREYKGVDGLLEAFVQAEMPSARLIIAGEPKPESLGRRIADAAAANPQIDVLPERLDDDTLKRFISACDVVVLPYVDSLTSGASILAASLARPIIAPRIGCLADLPESSAIFYDVARPMGLQEALRRALQSPLDQMGLEARDFIMQFPFSRVARELTGVYSEILGTRNDDQASIRPEPRRSH